jgi:2-polyprenyl-3-methyl-5-hydroxy-6-metoxy-1,4-benzoquinol methylase
MKIEARCNPGPVSTTNGTSSVGSHFHWGVVQRSGEELMPTPDKSESFQAYERAVIGTERALHTYMKRFNTIYDLAGGYEGKRILDIGCGFGFRTVGVAQRGALSVHAIDADAERIREAAHYAGVCNVQNAEFRVMDAANLIFDDESFDLVLADEMIHHLSNVPIVFNEIHRVLKTSGAAVISDHNRLSMPSELIRTMYFGKRKERVYTAREVKDFFVNARFRHIAWKHIIFTMPFANAPGFILKINYWLESMIELTPVLQTQCGVYVIRGVK